MADHVVNTVFISDDNYVAHLAVTIISMLENIGRNHPSSAGSTLLAGKAVGAPFVGAVAATLAIAEILRLLHGGSVLQLVDLDLQWPEHREIVPQRRNFSRMNPGYLRAA